MEPAESGKPLTLPGLPLTSFSSRYKPEQLGPETLVLKQLSNTPKTEFAGRFVL